MSSAPAASDPLDAFFQKSHEGDFIPFPQAWVEERMLLFPVNYKLDDEWFRVFTEVAREGDERFCIRLLEGGWTGESRAPAQSEHCFEFGDLASYRALTPLENITYSPTGKWGIFFSSEEFAVVAGHRPFVPALRRRWPSSQADMKAGLIARIALWRKVGDEMSWLEPLLEEIRP